TTAGFRDILELRRGARTHVLDPRMEKPWVFVPRRWRKELVERVLHDGTVLTSLKDDAIASVVEELVGEGVQSIAVCLLHSYANAAHERAVRAFVERHYPELSVTLSSDLLPEIGEYERTSTAALNAYVQPTVERYIRALKQRLRELNPELELRIMQSSGGVI